MTDKLRRGAVERQTFCLIMQRRRSRRRDKSVPAKKLVAEEGKSQLFLRLSLTHKTSLTWQHSIHEEAKHGLFCVAFFLYV